jgi:LacI family transcriptional regulator
MVIGSGQDLRTPPAEPGGPDPDASRRRRSRPGRSGGVPATIDDVAEHAGVSIATVSRVLRGTKAVRPATQQRVRDAVDALCYRPSGPARALAGRRTRTLGLIMTDLAQTFYAELSRAVESAALERGYTMVFASGAGDEQREASYLDLLAEQRVDGILVASWGITRRHIDWLVDAPLEVVLLSCKAPGIALPAVLADSREGASVAVEHLIGLGHRDIGVIAGPSYSAAAHDREVGLLETLAEHGVALSDRFVAHSTGDFETGRGAAAELLAAEPRPTALVCYNDLVAAGALKAAVTAGLRVPADLSIVGFDDVPLASMVEPSLTTVAQPIEAMAVWAVEQLQRQISAFDHGEAAPPASVVHMPCRLVIRGSTAAVPA